MGERDEPHSYRYIPQPRGRTTPFSSWETATSIKMAVESMEMALGAIPHPGRVPERRILSPKIGLQWRRRCGILSRKMLIDLGFSRRRLYIGGGAMSEDTRGSHTTGWCGQWAPAPPCGVATSFPPPSLLWTPSRVGENRNFGICFVQFWEYFLYNFSETQK
jgi:hypothetical protein